MCALRTGVQTCALPIYWDDIEPHLLVPIGRPPRHPISMARFGLQGLRRAESVPARFRTDEVRALFAGVAAHAFLPPDRVLSASFGLMLRGLAHAHGRSMVRGGTQKPTRTGEGRVGKGSVETV